MKAKNVALYGIAAAVLVVVKFVLAFLPNIELVSFLIIMFTLKLGRKMLYVIPVFVCLEIILYGFNVMWVFSYMYIWFVLYFAVRIFKNDNSSVSFAIISGFFGLIFGFLSSLPLLFISFGGYSTGIGGMIAYWIAGIPFDIVHGVSNFVIMIVLYKPTKRVLDCVKI